MSVFTTFSRRKPAATPPDQPCPDLELGPHWNSIEDMGHRDRVAYFVCTACGKSILPDEVNAARP